MPTAYYIDSDFENRVTEKTYSAELTGLLPGTAYTLKVYADELYGNRSAALAADITTTGKANSYRTGDLNKDGKIDASDSVLLQTGMAAGSSGLDIDGNGIVESKDLTALSAMVNKSVAGYNTNDLLDKVSGISCSTSGADTGAMLHTGVVNEVNGSSNRSVKTWAKSALGVLETTVVFKNAQNWANSNRITFDVIFDNESVNRTVSVSLISGAQGQHSNLVEITASQDGWNTFTLPLYSFENVDFTDVTGIAFRMDTSSATDGKEHAFYVDNLYASTVIAEDDDMLKGMTNEYLFGGEYVYGVGFTNHSNQALATTGIEMDAYFGFDDGITFTTAAQLVFDVKLEGTGSVTAQLCDIDWEEIGLAIELSCVDGYWISNGLTLEDFGLTEDTLICGAVLKNENGSKVFLDNMKLAPAVVEPTATEETEAETDLLANAELKFNYNYWDNYEEHWNDNTPDSTKPSGLTIGTDTNNVYGEKSLRSWCINANTAATVKGAVAQLHLNQMVDFSSHYLMFDLRYDVKDGNGDEATDASNSSFSVRMHGPNWDDVTKHMGLTLTPNSDWTTMKVDPTVNLYSDSTRTAKLTDITDVSLLTFTFSFDANTGYERSIYIDNVRAVKKETIEDDWIHMKNDPGEKETYNVTHSLDYDIVRTAEGSSTSLKLVNSTDSEGRFCFSPQAAFGENYDMSTATLGAWFYFGDQEPKASLTLSGNWILSSKLAFNFTNGGDGWYYGTVDISKATFSEAGGTLTDIERFRIYVPAGYTVYLDMLQRFDTSIANLNIDYVFNTESIQQDATVTNRFDALTFISGKNETESAQMILKPSADVASYQLTMNELRSESGAVIPASAFEVYVQHYITVDYAKNGAAVISGWSVQDPEAYVNGPTGIYPDALVPMHSKIITGENTISAGKNQGIWVNLNVDKSFAAGTYTGNATLTVDGKNVQIPVSVTVYDVTVPDEVHTRSSASIWWDEMAAWVGSVNSNNETVISSATASAYFDYIVSKRVMPMDYYLATQETGKNYIKKIVNELADDPAVSSYSLPYAIMTDANGDAIKDENGYNQLNEGYLKAMLTNAINANIEAIKAGNNIDIFAKAYFYFGKVCDEPRNDEKYALVNKCTALLERVKAELAPMLDAYPTVQESFNNLKHLVTGPTPADTTYHGLNKDSLKNYGSTMLEGSSYIYVPQVFWYSTQEQRDLYAQQEELWLYSCTHPVLPFASNHVNDELLSSRVISWMQYDYGVVGQLFWTFNDWTHGVGKKGTPSGTITVEAGKNDLWAEGNNGYTTAPGDGLFIYPGITYGLNSPIGTIRLESIREGNEDYEYMWLFEQLVNKYNSLFGTAHDADTLLDTYFTGLYNGTIPTDNVETFHKNRIALLERLEQLSVYLNSDSTGEQLSDMLGSATGIDDNLEHWEHSNSDTVTNLYMTEETEIVNGSQSSRSWHFQALDSANMAEAYANFPLNRTFDARNKSLVFDVLYTTDAPNHDKTLKLSARFQGSIMENFHSVVIAENENWQTVVMDFNGYQKDGNTLEAITNVGFKFDFASNSGVQRDVYIDNVRLVDSETVTSDWSNAPLDTGASTTTYYGLTQDAAMVGDRAFRVGASTADRGIVFNTQTPVQLSQMDAIDMSEDGKLVGAYFYFGDSTPYATFKIQGSSGKGSIPIAMEFAHIGYGWYYGYVNTTDIAFYDDEVAEANKDNIIRIYLAFRAGDEIFVDGLGFVDSVPEEIEPTTPQPLLDGGDMLANATLEHDKALWDGTGASFDDNCTVVNGVDSDKSWKFYTSVAGTTNLGVQLKLNETFDGTNKDLVFDVKFENMKQSLSVELWNNQDTLSENKIPVTVYGSGEWQTVVVPAAAIQDVYGDKAMNEIFLIRFNFNFTPVMDASAERAAYIDNVRFTEPGKVTPNPDKYEDLLSGAGTSVSLAGSGYVQYTQTNGSNEAWKLTETNTNHVWDYITFTFRDTFSIAGKKLLMDVKATDTASARIRLNSVNRVSVDGISGTAPGVNNLQKLTPDQWTSVVFDLDSIINAKEELNSITETNTIGFTVQAGAKTDVATYYIDNVRLVDADKDDLLDNPSSAVGTLQENVANNSNLSWMIDASHFGNSTHLYAAYTFEQQDISGKLLVMDVRADNVDSMSHFSMTHIGADGTVKPIEIAKHSDSDAFTYDGQWHTLKFEVAENTAGLTQMDSFRIYINNVKGQDFKIYIDNVHLEAYERVDDDWINMAIDEGDSTASYEIDKTVVKAENSAWSMKVTSGTADSTWTLSPETEFTKDNLPNFTEGVFGGYFRFDSSVAEPFVKIRLTDIHWNGGATLNFNLEELEDGWYYGWIDVSTIYFYANQTSGTKEQIIRIKLTFPANSTTYVDGLKFDPTPYVPPVPETEPPTEPPTTEPPTEPPVAEDLLSAATLHITGSGSIQQDEQNGSVSAWKLVTNQDANRFSTPYFTFDGVDISGKKLLMDVKATGTTSANIQIGSLNGKNTEGCGEKYSLTIDKWTSVSFDMDSIVANKTALAGATEMTALGLWFECASQGNTPVYYVDNVRLVNADKGDLFDDALNSGGFFQETVTNNSGLAWKLAPGDASTTGVWKNVKFTLDNVYTLTNTKLVMDVKQEGLLNFRFNIANVDDKSGTGYKTACWLSDSQWKTVEFDMNTLVANAPTMQSVTLTIWFQLASAEEAGAFYIDNVRLEKYETTTDDILYGATKADNFGHFGGTAAGLYDSSCTDIYGDSSVQSWKFYTTDSAKTGGAPILLKLNGTFDATGKDLVFDAKFLNSVQKIGLKVMSQSDQSKATELTWYPYGSDGYQTVVVPSETLASTFSTQDLTKVSHIFLRVYFDGDTTQERGIIIDNMRFVDAGTVEPTIDRSYDLLDNYGVTLTSSAGTAALQKDVTNMSDSACAFAPNSTGAGKALIINLQKDYDITNKILVMDVYPTGANSMVKPYGINGTNYESKYKFADTRVIANKWNSVAFDIGQYAKVGDSTAKSLYLYFYCNVANAYIYIDNVRILPANTETVENDWVNLPLDMETANHATNAAHYQLYADKAYTENSASIKVQTEARSWVTFNASSLTAKPNMTAGTLKAYIWFGEQTPYAAVHVVNTAGTAASAAVQMQYTALENGWYECTLDVSNINLEGKTSIKLIKIIFEANYEVYIDQLTFTPA